MKKDKNKDFTKLTHKKGISLIVLIVTIIVIIILAAVVIFTISKNNPIENAKESTFKEDVRSFEVELALAVSKEYTSKAGQRDNKFNETELTKIQDYIPSFSEKYSEKFIIQDDELRYTDEVDEKEKEWLKELNIKEMESLLPEGYTELEYIESTGTQYIDTGYIFDGSNYEIETKASITKLNSQWAILCGERHNVDNLQIRNGGIGFNYDINYINYAENGYANVILGKTELNKQYVWNVYYDNVNKYVLASRNNEEPFKDFFNSSLLGGKSIYIFGFNANKLDFLVSAKLYYFKIKQDNKLVRDFIPALDKNNVPCLYDKVEGENYYNQGTGEFVVGPKK